MVRGCPCISGKVYFSVVFLVCLSISLLDDEYLN